MRRPGRLRLRLGSRQTYERTGERVKPMCPLLPNDDEQMDDEQVFGRATSAPPERFNRRKTTQRVLARARRSRSNEMAKRGMHQRRNKRATW